MCSLCKCDTSPTFRARLYKCRDAQCCHRIQSCWDLFPRNLHFSALSAALTPFLSLKYQPRKSSSPCQASRPSGGQPSAYAQEKGRLGERNEHLLGPAGVRHCARRVTYLMSKQPRRWGQSAAFSPMLQMSFTVRNLAWLSFMNENTVALYPAGPLITLFCYNIEML